MKNLNIEDPETFHLRRRILDMAGIPYRHSKDVVELEQDLESLPDRKQRLVKAALLCRLDWHAMKDLSAKEKVAIGVAAMDVDSYHAKHPTKRSLTIA